MNDEVPLPLKLRPASQRNEQVGRSMKVEDLFIQSKIMKKIIVLVFCLGLLLSGCGQGTTNANTNIASDNPNAPVNESVNTNVNKAVGTTLVKVLISDVADAKGSVYTGKSTFTTETPELAVSAYILKAEKGLKVTAVMAYLPTGDKVGPVSNDTQTAGDIISNFSFSKPTEGWPSGEYSVTISLSDGQNMTINFNIP